MVVDKPKIFGSRLRRGEWYVLKPEPHRRLIYAATWQEALEKAEALIRKMKRKEAK